MRGQDAIQSLMQRIISFLVHRNLLFYCGGNLIQLLLLQSCCALVELWVEFLLGCFGGSLFSIRRRRSLSCSQLHRLYVPLGKWVGECTCELRSTRMRTRRSEFHPTRGIHTYSVASVVVANLFLSFLCSTFSSCPVLQVRRPVRWGRVGEAIKFIYCGGVFRWEFEYETNGRDTTRLPSVDAAG